MNRTTEVSTEEKQAAIERFLASEEFNPQKNSAETLTKHNIDINDPETQILWQQALLLEYIFFQ